MYYIVCISITNVLVCIILLVFIKYNIIRFFNLLLEFKILVKFTFRLISFSTKFIHQKFFYCKNSLL